MTHNRPISDEMLNAFIDDELDKAEREVILELLEQDPELAQRLCELTRLKELVRTARPEVDDSVYQYKVRKLSNQRWAYAAMILLTLSVGTVVFISDRLPSRQDGINNSIQAVLKQHANATEIKVVMQLTSNDVNLMSKLLDQAETLVNMSRQLDKPVRVEVVAYGKGLTMLRSDQSPFAQRISSLRRQYDNLLFVACQETLSRQQQKAQASVPLLPGVVIVHSGAGEVKLRRSQGWSVLKT